MRGRVRSVQGFTRSCALHASRQNGPAVFPYLPTNANRNRQTCVSCPPGRRYGVDTRSLSSNSRNGSSSNNNEGYAKDTATDVVKLKNEVTQLRTELTALKGHICVTQEETDARSGMDGNHNTDNDLEYLEIATKKVNAIFSELDSHKEVHRQHQYQ